MAGSVDVVVIGAGPAGIAAGVAAAAAGARVVLLDDAPRPGGQYWRHGVAGLGPHHHDRRGWRELSDALAEHRVAGRIELRPAHRVWRLEPPPASAGTDGTGEIDVTTIHAVTDADAGSAARVTACERPVTLTARAVVVATGAHDRVLPFPGWDLPGVLTPGAVQTLLKEHGVPAGRRVVVAGSGPFLLPVAASLLRVGATVVALAEAGDGRGWLTGGRAVLGRGARMREAAGYAAVLARHGVRPRLRTAVVEAHGTDAVAEVTLARLDRAGAVVPGTARRVACDAVAVGWGFTARVELALQAGAVAVPGPDGGPAVAADPWGRTAVPGVLVAGELLGIGGAALAVVTGRLAGTAAAAHALGGLTPGAAPGAAPEPVERRLIERRRQLIAFAEVLHRAHPVPPAWPTWLRDDTLVCRCEEVPLARLREAVDLLGATDARTAKLLTRCGMGWCQGRMCGEALARLVGDPAAAGTSHPHGRDVGLAARPVAVPLTLQALATDPMRREVGP